MGCMCSPSAPQFAFEDGSWCFSFPKPRWFFLSFPVVVPPNVYSTSFLKKKKKVQDQAKKDRKRKRKVNLNFLPCFLWELSVMLIRCAWLCVRACAKHVLAHWYVSWANSPQFSIVVASVTFLCGVKIWELAVSYPLSLLCLLVAWLFHHSVPWTFVSLGKGWWKCSLFVLMRTGVTLLNYP